MATQNHTPESVSTPKKTITTDQVSHEVLKHYIASRDKIDRELSSIMAFTSLLSQYKDCSGDEVFVDIYSLGYVNAMLHSKACDILEELDLFLPLWDAKVAVIEGVTEEAQE